MACSRLPIARGSAVMEAAGGSAEGCCSPSWPTTLSPGLALENRLCLVLESACLDRAVHAALLRGVLLPPPSAGARILARTDRTRAGRTANAPVSPVIEWMVRDVMLPNVGEDLLFHPVSQGIDLNDAAVIMVELDLADIRSGCPLIAAEAGNPRIEIRQHPAERFDLADLAAGQAILHRFVEEIHAVLANKRLQELGIRGIDLDLDAVVLADAVDHLVGLGGQPPGIDREDAHLRIDPPGHIQDGHAVHLKARADGDPRAKGLQRPANDLLRFLVVVQHRELSRLVLVQDHPILGQHPYPPRSSMPYPPRCPPRSPRSTRKGLDGPSSGDRPCGDLVPFSDGSQLLITQPPAEVPEAFALLTALQEGSDQPLDVVLHLIRRHAAQD